MITDAQWQTFETQGYLNLGKLLSDDDVSSLQKRIDDIMLGRASIDYNRLLMQLDSTTGQYDDAGVQSNGHKGATLAYRKIQNLEADDLFAAYLSRPVFQEICARAYGKDA